MFAACRCRTPIPPCASPISAGLNLREVGAVLAAGTAIRLIALGSCFALCGSAQQAPANPNRAARHGTVIAFAIHFRPASRSSSLVLRMLSALAHRADCRRDDPRCSARPVPVRVDAWRSVSCLRRGNRRRWSRSSQATSFDGIIWMNGTLLALAAVAALAYPEMRWTGREKPTAG